MAQIRPVMLQYNILISGANSGIGKAFVRFLLRDPANGIVAVDKNFSSPTSSPGCIDHDSLHSLETYRKDVGDDTGSRVQILPMDVTNENQLAQLSTLNDLQLVIHSAGVRGLVPAVPITEGSNVAGAETMEVMTLQTLEQTFHTNTIGTFLLLRRLLPNLRSNNGKVIIMGSRMGSVGYNSIGGGYAYRASKAALNAIVKSFSIDVPEVCFAIIHPGRVESNLVGEGIREEGAVTAEESVSNMLNLISRLDRHDSGRFMDRFGDDIVW